MADEPKRIKKTVEDIIFTEIDPNTEELPKLQKQLALYAIARYATEDVMLKTALKLDRLRQGGSEYTV